ncbi:MAG: Ig-like domain-containing protein [Lachnospiraceae bacterium]
MEHRKKQFKKSCAALLLGMILAITECATPLTAQAVTKPSTTVKSIRLNKNTIKIDRGKQLTLKASILPKKAKNAKLQWKSSKPKVVMVNQKGKITAKKAGTAKITVTVKGTKKSAKCTVKVLIPVSKLSVSPAKTTVKIKQKVQLKATISPKNASYRTLVYQSQNKNIASVTTKGVVEGKKAGTTTILVQVKGTKKQAKISVTVKGAVTPKPSDLTNPSEQPSVGFSGSNQQQPSEMLPSVSFSRPDQPALPSTEMPSVTEEGSLAKPSGTSWVSIVPSEPSKSASASKPSEPSKSVSVAKPSEPSESASASKPSEPSKSASASKPSEPSKSVSASKPSEPSKSASVSKPSEPSENGSVSKPDEPSKNVDSSKPNEPSKSASASKPSEPSGLTDGSKPFDESKPAEPSKTEPSSGEEASSTEEPPSNQSKPSKDSASSEGSEKPSTRPSLEPSSEEEPISDHWALAQLKIGGKQYDEDIFDETEDDQRTVWKVDLPYPQGKEWSVLAKDPDVTVHMEDSDVDGYEKKLVLKDQESEEISYLSFKESDWDGLHILKLYQNGISQDWRTEKRIIGENQITELYLDQFEVGDDLQIVPQSEQTMVKIEESDLSGYKKKLILTNGEKSRNYYLCTFTESIENGSSDSEDFVEDPSIPTTDDTAWEIASLTIGDTVYPNEEWNSDEIWEQEDPEKEKDTDDQADVNDDKNLQEPHSDTYFSVKGNELQVYGLQEHLEGSIQVTMQNETSAVVTVLEDQTNPENAQIRIEYQGRIKVFRIRYRINPSIWEIEQVKIGKEVVDFSRYRNEITVYDKQARLSDDVEIVMKNKDVTVEKAEDCFMDNFQKKVDVSYQGHFITLYLKTKLPTSEKKQLQKVNQLTIGSQVYIEKQISADHYYEYDHNRLILFGTEPLTTEQLQEPEWKLIARVAAADIKIEDTAREGYVKRITMQYEGYLQIYYVTYELMPSVWQIASIQTENGTYSTDTQNATGYVQQIIHYNSYEQSVNLVTNEKQPVIMSVTLNDAQATCGKEDITYDQNGIPVSMLLHCGEMTKKLTLNCLMTDEYWEVESIQTEEKIYTNETEDTIENFEDGCNWYVSEKQPVITSVTTKGGTFAIRPQDITYKDEIPVGIRLQSGGMQKELQIRCRLQNELLQVAALGTDIGILYPAQSDEEECNCFSQEGDVLCIYGAKKTMPNLKEITMKHAEEVTCSIAEMERDEQGNPQALRVQYGIFTERIKLYYEQLDDSNA